MASLLTLTLSAGSAAAAAGATSCTHGFKPVKVRDLDGRWKTMGATSVTVAPGSHEAWATGSMTRTAPATTPAPYDSSEWNDLLHFDGRRWTRMPQPLANARQILTDIDARSPSDVWAVGWRWFELGNGTRQPLVEHWDGTRWTIVPIPIATPPNEDTDVYGGRLEEVIALASDDVWAIGRADNKAELVYHWDGTRWTRVDAGRSGVDVPNPDPDLEPWDSNFDRFAAVVRAPYSSTLWFLGDWTDGIGGYGPLLQRYKAGSWTEPLVLNWADVPVSPMAGAALAWDDIWAVGGGQDGSAGALHKDAYGWGVVPTPKPATGTATLRSVAAVSATDVWAVGSTGTPTAELPLIEHWDGEFWSIAPSPLDGSEGRLLDIALRKSGWGWVVGEAAPGNPDGVILQACAI